jgi:hypothetical protein
VPPRPHPIVLTALVAGCLFVALLLMPGGIAHAGPGGVARGAPRPVARAAAQPAVREPARGAVGGVVRATWRWPLRGPVVGSFRLAPRTPFARGQRRGIDVAAAPGSAVRAACTGRVSFAGALPSFGLAVSVRCGPLVATYLRLGRLAVRRGAPLVAGERLGTVGRAGLLRLGARRASDRRGYVDPLALLRDPGPSPPAVAPPLRLGRPRRPAAHRPADPRALTPRPSRPLRLARPSARRRGPLLRPAPRAAAPDAAAPPARANPRGLPWPAYPALALIATALPVSALVQRRRRRSRSPVVAASHEGT